MFVTEDLNMITVRLMEELKKDIKFMLLLLVVLRWKFIRVMLVSLF